VSHCPNRGANPLVCCFSKLDTNCGFWQIPLSESCKNLTTFITPFACYYIKQLPFGICSALEHFQLRMSAIIAGNDKALCHMDDVFIFGRQHDEHDTGVYAALHMIQEAGVTLNPEKCEFSRRSITLLGHVISEQGISADPSKTQAVTNMERPRTSPTAEVYGHGKPAREVFSYAYRTLLATSDTPQPLSCMVVGSSKGRGF